MSINNALFLLILKNQEDERNKKQKAGMQEASCSGCIEYGDSCPRCQERITLELNEYK